MHDAHTKPLRLVLLTLGDPGKLTGGYLYHSRMAALAPRHNASLSFVSLPDWPFPLGLFAAPRVLRRARLLGPDAFVLDSIAAASLGPWLSPGPAQPPVIGMLHQPPGGIDYGPVHTILQAVLDRLAYRRACRLLVASESLMDDLIAQGIPRGKMRVVPPGRDLAGSPEPPSEAEGERQDLRQGRRAAFLSVGNWMERKGILSLLDAFARLPVEAGTLHLAGDDRIEPRYARRVRERLGRRDLQGRVVVYGPLPSEGVARLYRAADVFVLPSLKEPYGTVYGEAMAYGLPVVGWRAGNLPYLAGHAREGLLVQPGNLEGLARAMQRLSEDEVLRRQLGEAARRRAMMLPTWEGSAALFFGGIREAIQECPHGARITGE
jgi:glycosyltransferase involved in cell wall biosynthesis